jgi:hypothetical protein
MEHGHKRTLSLNGSVSLSSASLLLLVGILTRNILPLQNSLEISYNKIEHCPLKLQYSSRQRHYEGSSRSSPSSKKVEEQLVTCKSPTPDTVAVFLGAE